MDVDKPEPEVAEEAPEEEKKEEMGVDSEQWYRLLWPAILVVVLVGSFLLAYGMGGAPVRVKSVQRLDRLPGWRDRRPEEAHEIFEPGFPLPRFTYLVLTLECDQAMFGRDYFLLRGQRDLRGAGGRATDAGLLFRPKGEWRTESGQGVLQPLSEKPAPERVTGTRRIVFLVPNYQSEFVFEYRDPAAAPSTQRITLPEKAPEGALSGPARPAVEKKAPEEEPAE